MSNSEIERLGLRLTKVDPPQPADVAQLHELLAAYEPVLSEAETRVRTELAVSSGSRIKDTGTIIEKLDRNGGHGLKSIHDLAGMRIVIAMVGATNRMVLSLASRTCSPTASMPRS